jgi:hypothetical protein
MVNGNLNSLSDITLQFLSMFIVKQAFDLANRNLLRGGSVIGWQYQTILKNLMGWLASDSERHLCSICNYHGGNS